MRGQRYQALIVVILLLTALPYSPFLSRAASIDKDPLAEKDFDGDGIPDPPMRDSDGDGLSDDYEIALGFDPNDFDMDDDGISDLMEQQMWDDLKNMDEIPESMEDLYDCEGDLDGDGITNCMDPDADGDGLSDQEEMMDSDGDGIPDMYENMIDHLDPNNPDSDGDGIPDKEDQDPPLPEWAEEMSNKNDWTPQPDSNGMGGLEGFYPLAMLAAVKFTVTCDTCEDPTSNPQYWRTVAKTIYDNGYNPDTNTYDRSQWCPAPGCEQYDIETGVVDNPGYWSTGSNPYSYDYLVTHPDITSEQHQYTMTWIMPVQGYLSTSLYTNNVFIGNSATMDSSFNLKVDGYAQTYTFTMTEYNIPESVKQTANAPSNFPSQFTEVPQFPIRDGPNNDIYDLAASITAGRETDYEKAEAIMYYLRSNYYYNINGTLTPDGEDFVDFFLFGNEGTDGKCTNFASAFTILSRISGIPTRYVEGNGPGEVITPQAWQDSGYGESTGYQIQEDTRIITMLNGHAYAEVLFDEIGWLTFEPTSSTTCPTCDANGGTTTGDDDSVVGNGTQPGTDYVMSDTDDDGLSDEYEIGIGTDPFNPDSDFDTLPDGAETNTGIYVNTENTGTDPLSKDTDGDGLEDDDEILCRLYSDFGKFCSHPLDSDSDNDGISDGDEYNGIDFNGEIIKTNPIHHDSDSDGLTDGLELGITGDIFENEFNSNSCDTKGGTSVLTGCTETWQPDEDPNSTTNPRNSDSDGDGIEDGIEDLNHNGRLDLTPEDEDPCNGETDPAQSDTDQGGRNDLQECENDSTNPLDPDDDISDSDGDGILDHIEESNCIYGIAVNQCTDLTKEDTDDDGVSDYDEIFNCIYGENNDQCTDPTLDDSDSDTIPDNTEITNCIYGEDTNQCTDPTLLDTDGGGANDGLEIITDFTNPIDPNDDIQLKDRDDDEDGLTNAEEDINQNGVLDAGETDPNNPDTDGDLLNDGEEVKVQLTDPNKKDSDGDEIEDGEEVFNLTWGPTDPNKRDSDDDGLFDGYEVTNCIYGENSDQCTNPNIPDSDGDTISDGDEVNNIGSDPKDTDSDNDGLEDGDEINTHSTDPSLKDTDVDGLEDGDEINIYFTDPNNPDTDDDDLEDGDEVNNWFTNPTRNDTDLDGLLDADEIFNTTWGPTNATNPDTDNGGQKDGLEVLLDGTNPNDPDDDDLSGLDDDEDGLTNGEEENIYFTDPNDRDTDDDGLEDGDEVNNWFTNPIKNDTDIDGIEDGTETTTCIYGEDDDECTDPNNPDSDGDTISDGDEINEIGSDPKDADTDNDGLGDLTEFNNCIYGPGDDECTSLIEEDSDGDGIIDGNELGIYFTDPMSFDTDDDGMSDGDEVTDCIYGENNNLCTNPNIPDSDGDTISDGDEINEIGSDPKDTDSDNDELSDGTELSNCIYGDSSTECTNPIEEDSDFDGINDNVEIFDCIYGEDEDECTDPTLFDSDGDNVGDGLEINTYTSNPLVTDTDEDGLDDGDEVNIYGTNPVLTDSDYDNLGDYVELNNCTYGQNNTGSDCTNPINPDSDSDGVEDGDEVNTYGTDPMDEDSDGDLLTDGQELGGLDGNSTSHGHGPTDPLDNDSDDGGIRDGTEVDTDDTNPNDINDDFLDALDNDGDGLSNGEELLYGTNPENPDSDGDTITDGDEVYGLNNTYEYNSNPNEEDSDFDGIDDAVEVSNCIYGESNNICTDPMSDDSDNDGIEDKDEIDNCIYGENNNQCTDPKDSDSDDDSISDGLEIEENPYLTNPLMEDSDGDAVLDNWEEFYNTNPLVSDTDSDGIDDYNEIHNCIYGEDNNECTDPNNSDSDNDQLNDFDEVNNCLYGENGNQCTDPKKSDSDGDGINDYEEINTHDTNPMKFDTDLDGLSDGLEINDLESNPLNEDTDDDGLVDAWEYDKSSQGYQYGLNTNDTDGDGTLDGDEDLDSDGLTNLEELNTYFTDPAVTDSDSDSLWDGDEVNPWEIDRDSVNNLYNYPSNPNLNDTDGDNLSDYEEITQSNDTYSSRTNPDDSDTDDDGLSDYYEIRWYWNTTGDDNTPRSYYDEQGWNTSDPREENTDGDTWNDGDTDEENPVYGYFEEEDPPWGSPPARAGTPNWPPEEVFKNQEFNWSFGPLVNPESGEAYVGLQIDAYINETQDSDGVSYKIGNGTTDSDGFMVLICNGSSLSSTIKAGNWFLQLYREEQFINHEGVSTRIPAEWRDSPPLAINITGNVTIDVIVPTTAASDGTTLITGSLFEDEDIPVQGSTISLQFDNVTYSENTNENGIFTIEIDTPVVEDENYDLFFEYIGNENLTGQNRTESIRIINASVEFRFDEGNENTFELGQEYSINGTIFGDEDEQPTGFVQISYGDIAIGQTEIIGNQAWSVDFLVPQNASWGNTILTARFSGNEIYPEDVEVDNIVVRGESNLTLDKSTFLRTDDVILRGNLTDHNGQTIEDKSITFSMGGKLIGSTITQSDGSYIFTINLSTEESGMQEITAELYGSPTLSSSAAKNNLTLIATPKLIFDESASCEISENIYTYLCRAPEGSEHNLSGIIFDELGNPIVNAKIEFFSEEEGFAPPFQTQDDGRFNYIFKLEEDQLERFTIDIKIEDDLEEVFLLETDYEITISPQSEVTIDLTILNEKNKVFRGNILELEGTIIATDAGALTSEDGDNFYVTIWLGTDMIMEGLEIVNSTYFTGNYKLPDNFNTGDYNVTVTFEETNSYLSSNVSNSLIVSGTSSFENINVRGDWFNDELRRGGNIEITGILVDDLGNRIAGDGVNISAKIGDTELNTIFTNQSTFISSGTIPEDYRNNRTMELQFDGDDYLLGGSKKSKHSILVESKIRFDFEPQNVFPGDNVNVSIWLEEDDGSPIPESEVSVIVNLFYDKKIEMDTELEYNLTTDLSGFARFNFEFPEDASSASIQATFLGGYIRAYDDTPQETELTVANVAISITKSPEAKEPFDINKYLPLFIGIPAALLVTAYYLYWTQKHKYEVRNLIKQMQKELNKDEDYRQIIIKSYHQLLNILDRYGFIKTKTQTVREFTDVMRTALPIPTQSVKLLTSLFEIARYSGIKPKVVDEFGMEMIDGSYNIWCVEAINNLHEVEMELNKGLKEGKVSRFTNIFGMRSSK